MHFRKDASLDKLAEVGNVAQFVSFVPDGVRLLQGFCRIAGYAPNHAFHGADEAIGALVQASPERRVNVRSYAPDSPRSREFVYGIKSAAEALGTARRLTGEGLHVIVNETVDVTDGGVSGVIQGNVIEFAPDDTPRCVEKPGTASLPLDWGLALIEAVYGVRPDLPSVQGRLEFSIHPIRRGWRRGHTLAWEFEEGAEDISITPSVTWPNRFSAMIGDKAYGLLMAHVAGQPVPRTLVVGRRIAPFQFGVPTGSAEKWIRTCPANPEPGLFTTAKGWCDPFALLSREDPDGGRIASVLSQDAIPASFSGAALVGGDGRLIVEGVPGEGDDFMLGKQVPRPLPRRVTASVEEAYGRAAARFGAVRFEWVHDGRTTWIVQMHRGATATTGAEVVPGNAETWVRLDASAGLEMLRTALGKLEPGIGIVLVGEVGLTSHIADLIRKAGVPTRLAACGPFEAMPGLLI